MKCHVINLDRSPERLGHITRIFGGLGLEFERVAAIDGGSLSDAQFQHLISRSNWLHELTRNEVGCFLSHRECLRRIADNDAPWGAVFEDDIVLSPRIGTLFQELDWIPEGTDMVKLDTVNKRCTVGSIHPITAGGGYWLARLLSKHYGTGGYLVSRPCAKKLYDLTEYVAAPIDEFYFNPDFGLLRELNIQQMIPAPVRHAGLVSLIRKRRIDKIPLPWHRKLVREISQIYRRQILRLWLALRHGYRTGRIAFK